MEIEGESVEFQQRNKRSYGLKGGNDDGCVRKDGMTVKIKEKNRSE